MNYNQYKEKLKEEFNKYKENLKENLKRFKEKQNKKLEKFKIKSKKIKGGVNISGDLDNYITTLNQDTYDSFNVDKFKTDNNNIYVFFRSNTLQYLYSYLKSYLSTKKDININDILKKLLGIAILCKNRIKNKQIAIKHANNIMESNKKIKHTFLNNIR